MKVTCWVLCTIVAVLSGCSRTIYHDSRAQQADTSLVRSKTELEMSEKLRNMLDVREIEISDKIWLKISKCENYAVVPLSVLSSFSKVDIFELKVLVEDKNKTKQKSMFTAINDGGLSDNQLFSIRLNLTGFNPGVTNVWAFLIIENKAYANAIQIECRVVH